jgi:hypothetical protein
MSQFLMRVIMAYTMINIIPNTNTVIIKFDCIVTSHYKRLIIAYLTIKLGLITIA